MTDAELCQRALDAKGWKQKELAAFLEMNETGISAVMGSHRKLPEGKRYLIGDLLDMRATQVRRLVATAATVALVAVAIIVGYKTTGAYESAMQSSTWMVAFAGNTNYRVFIFMLAGLIGIIVAAQQRQRPTARRGLWAIP